MITNTLSQFRMAEKLSIDQLTEALKAGTLDPSIGQLVLNNKIKLKEKFQAEQQGQPPQMPIAEENMQKAQMMSQQQNPMAQQVPPPQMAQQAQPQGYAQGGPIRFFDQYLDDNKERTALQYLYANKKYNTPTPLFGADVPMTADQKAAKTLLNRLPYMSTSNPLGQDEIGQAKKYGIDAFRYDDKRVIPARNYFAAKEPEPPKVTETPAGEKQPSESDKILAAMGGVGGVGFSMPKLHGYEGILAKLAEDPASKLSDLSSKRERELAAGDKEVFDAIRGKLDKSKDQLAKSDKQNAWLSLMKAGLATAAGTSQHAMANIGEGGIEGVNNYVQRDVLNRHMEQNLDQRDQALSLQELATRKSNQAAGDQYGSNLLNAELARTNAQGNIIGNKNQELMAGAQLKLQGDVAGANLNLEREKMKYTGALQREQLEARKQLMDIQMKFANAKTVAARSKAFGDFIKSDYHNNLIQSFNKQYGSPDWQTSGSTKALFIKGQYDDAVKNALSNVDAGDSGMMGMMGGIGGIGGINVPYADELLGMSQQ